MRFTLDDAARAVVRVTQDALSRAGSSDVDPWRALREAGVVRLAVPTWLGGDGLGPLEIMLALREIGRQAVAVPAYATLALGVLPVAAWGTKGQQRDLLTDLAVLTAAPREPSDPVPAAPRTIAGPGLAVTGTKIGVPYAAEARRILVPVSLTGGGSAVALIDPRAPGVTVLRTPSSSAAPEYTLRLDGAIADGLLGDEPAAAAVAGIYQLALAGAGALGAGAVAGALALTTAHIGRREQFGRPLATFQAVAQQIADVYITARTLDLAVLSAAWRLGTTWPATTWPVTGPPSAAGDFPGGVPGDVEVAAYWLAAQAPAALRTCHHLHGGLGLDVSYPLHRYTGMVADLVRCLGGAEGCLRRLGRAAPAGEAPCSSI